MNFDEILSMVFYSTKDVSYRKLKHSEKLEVIIIFVFNRSKIRIIQYKGRVNLVEVGELIDILKFIRVLVSSVNLNSLKITSLK